jgi:hypothetical protein
MATETVQVGTPTINVEPTASQAPPSEPHEAHTFQAIEIIRCGALITASAFEHRRALDLDGLVGDRCDDHLPHQCRVEREPGLTLGNFAVRELQGNV